MVGKLERGINMQHRHRTRGTALHCRTLGRGLGGIQGITTGMPACPIKQSAGTAGLRLCTGNTTGVIQMARRLRSWLAGWLTWLAADLAVQAATKVRQRAASATLSCSTLYCCCGRSHARAVRRYH